MRWTCFITKKKKIKELTNAILTAFIYKEFKKLSVKRHTDKYYFDSRS